jgi:predicted O-methyltransferase YrrM
MILILLLLILVILIIACKNKENFKDFDGVRYRLADNWYSTINVDDYKNKQINYLEIGTFYGANLLSVAKTYCANENSKLYCIDPWEDYTDYPEYKNQQPTIYNKFLSNIENSGYKDKIIIKRGYSNLEIPKFEDNFFDIIYIDGNHEPEYVLEDAVLSFRKLKKNGIMIFDDYGWGGPELTKKGIDAFLAGYHKKITYLGIVDTQVFIKKN